MTPFILAARPGLGAATLDELLGMARQAPGRITFASSGATSLPRFAAEQLARQAGVELSNVPYNGSPAALQDTLAGRVDLVIDGTPLLVPQIRARALTPLAITSASRFPGIEEVPAVAETLPGFRRVGWFGLLAPASTPADLVARIAEDARGVLAAAELRGRLLAEIGAEVVGSTPDAFARFAAAEREELGVLSRQLGVVLV
jgi:tripartite-type tricarboxylate transporter receptor subunit TctC